jgi:hypothetical protein
MFLQNAHLGSNKWWQYLVTLLMVVGGTIIGQLPLVAITIWMSTNGMASAGEIAEMSNQLDFSPVGIDKNLTLILVLLAFVFALLALRLGVIKIHKKPFNALITPASAINWRKIYFAFGVWMALTILCEIGFYLKEPTNYTLQFEGLDFVILLLICIFILPLQTSFEELMFRGYLMQGLSLISPFRWIPLLLTSVFFGALHFMNPEVAEFGLGISMVYYIGTGLFLGVLTLMDDSLELALGIHAATNIYSALFVTFDASALQTAALFHTGSINMPLMLAGFVISALLFTGIVARKYGWQDWSKIYGRIEKPLSSEA